MAQREHLGVAHVLDVVGELLEVAVEVEGTVIACCEVVASIDLIAPMTPSCGFDVRPLAIQPLVELELG